MRSGYLSAIYLGRGQVNIGLENFDRAINDFKKSLKIINDDVLKKSAIHLLGISYIKRGEKKILSKDFSDAISNFHEFFEATGLPDHNYSRFQKPEDLEIVTTVRKLLGISYRKRAEQKILGCREGLQDLLRRDESDEFKRLMINIINPELLQSNNIAKLIIFMISLAFRRNSTRSL